MSGDEAAEGGSEVQIAHADTELISVEEGSTSQEKRGAVFAALLGVVVVVGLIVFTQVVDRWEDPDADGVAPDRLVDSDAAPQTSGGSEVPTAPTLETLPAATVASRVITATTTTPTTLAPSTSFATTTTVLLRPENATNVSADGLELWCEASPTTGVQRCVHAHATFPAIISYASAPYWCDMSGCYDYDPRRYFEVDHHGRSYICEPGRLGTSGRADCAAYLGGPAPILIGLPELYCSTTVSTSQCSELWYPAELDQYEQFEIGGVAHLCLDAWQGGVGDLDCHRYTGGDPQLIGGTPSQYCSTYGMRECSTNWYPGELSRYDFYTLAGSQHICETATPAGPGDIDCYIYRGGDPGSSTSGLPDLYCSHGPTGRLKCDPSRYPSEIAAELAQQEAEWANHYVIEIDFRDYICKKGIIGDDPCVRYNGGAPSSHFFVVPVYTCVSNLFSTQCAPA